MKNFFSSLIVKKRITNRLLRFFHSDILKFKLCKRRYIFIDPKDICGPSYYIAYTGHAAFYHYETSVKSEILKFLPPNGVLFDIGANIGLISLFFGTFRPDSKIYSFEPTETTYNCLKLTMEHWKFNNIKLIKKGVSNKTSDNEILYCDSKSSGGNSLEENVIRDIGEKIAVQLTTLDDFVEKENTFPDVIKIDVEGHERFVLAGAWKTIEKYKPTIVIETNNQTMIDNFSNIFSKLTGYEVAHVGSQKYFPIEYWPTIAKEFLDKGIATVDYVLKSSERFGTGP